MRKKLPTLQVVSCTTISDIFLKFRFLNVTKTKNNKVENVQKKLTTLQFKVQVLLFNGFVTSKL